MVLDVIENNFWYIFLSSCNMYVQHGPGFYIFTHFPFAERICVTVAGASKGKPCIFPFKFNGVTYSECTWNQGRNSIALLKSQQTFQQTFQQSFQYYRGSIQLDIENSVEYFC